MSELDRAVAELLGWKEERTPADIPRWRKGESLRMWEPAPYSTDANQAQAAVMEWCGEDVGRCESVGRLLTCIVAEAHHVDVVFAYRLVTATPEQLCRALLAAAKENER